MSKRLILILALAFVVGISFAAYAEVQNVKVSGDLTVMGISRNNTDLAKERPTTNANRLIAKSDDYNNAISIARVRVDADLTDNVSTTVRLLNERVWGAEGDTDGSAGVILDLAYANLKEFLYSPLTLTVGRQELHFGNDFIVGDPDTNGVAASTTCLLPLYERDLSARKAFDAVRANFNYDPLVVDVIWAKLSDTDVATNDDTTLSGINANYVLDKQTNLEGYFFSKIKDVNAAGFSITDRATIYTGGTAHATVLSNVTNKADKVFTLGGKVRNSTVKNLTVDLESAFQFGTWNPEFNINSGDDAQSSNRKAWALEGALTYDLKDVKLISKYAPSITGRYVYLSGENAATKSNNKTWHGWDSMYENQTYGHLANVIMDSTNLTIAGLSGKMKPMDDLTLNLDYVYLWFNKAYGENDIVNLKNFSGANTYRMAHTRNFGQELDATLTYDYTEDVQFSLLAGVFVPGDAFQKGVNIANPGNRSTAGEVIGSMKVTF